MKRNVFKFLASSLLSTLIVSAFILPVNALSNLEVSKKVATAMGNANSFSTNVFLKNNVNVKNRFKFDFSINSNTEFDMKNKKMLTRLSFLNKTVNYSSFDLKFVDYKLYSYSDLFQQSYEVPIKKTNYDKIFTNTKNIVSKNIPQVIASGSLKASETQTEIIYSGNLKTLLSLDSLKSFYNPSGDFNFSINKSPSYNVTVTIDKSNYTPKNANIKNSNNPTTDPDKISGYNELSIAFGDYNKNFNITSN